MTLLVNLQAAGMDDYYCVCSHLRRPDSVDLGLGLRICKFLSSLMTVMIIRFGGSSGSPILPIYPLQTTTLENSLTIITKYMTLMI